jgi:hypothetical protein
MFFSLLLYNGHNQMKYFNLLGSTREWASKFLLVYTLYSETRLFLISTINFYITCFLCYHPEVTFLISSCISEILTIFY